MRRLTALGLAAAFLATSGSAASSRPPRVVATIRLGGDPIGLAFGAGSLWVADYGNGTLRRIDPARNRATARIPLGNSPYASAFGAGSVWVSSFDSGNVTRVDPATNRIVARIDAGVEQTGLAATATDVWVAIFGRGEVVRIDPATNTVTARITVGGNPEDVVLAAGSAWVPNENGSLARIDPATNSVTATIPIGADPDNAVFCRGLLWTSDRLGPYLRAVNPATDKVAFRVRVGVGSMGLACTKALWIANYDIGRVQKLDLSRRKVARRLDVGFQPREIELGAGALWVSNQGSGTVSRIRPS